MIVIKQRCYCLVDEWVMVVILHILLFFQGVMECQCLFGQVASIKLIDKKVIDYHKLIAILIRRV